MNKLKPEEIIGYGIENLQYLITDIYHESIQDIMSELEVNGRIGSAILNHPISLDRLLLSDEGADGYLIGCGTLEGYDVDDIYLNQVKPILNPISTIDTKWLAKNIVMKEDIDIRLEGGDIRIDHPKWDKVISISLKYYKNWPYGIIQAAQRDKIDYQNLIGQGKAIDASTLENNPYGEDTDL